MPNPDEMLIKSALPKDGGNVLRVTPESAGWTYVGLVVEQIAAGGSWEYSAEKDEICIVPLRGSAEIKSEHGEWTVSRPGTMFDGKPTCLYLPVGSSFTPPRGWSRTGGYIGPRDRSSRQTYRTDDIDIEIRGAGNAAGRSVTSSSRSSGLTAGG